jgi:hypothetical protein
MLSKALIQKVRLYPISLPAGTAIITKSKAPTKLYLDESMILLGMGIRSVSLLLVMGVRSLAIALLQIAAIR